MNKIDDLTRHKINKSVREKVPFAIHFDRQGQPMETGDWVAAFNDRDYTIVDSIEISDDVCVGTIWEGIDRGFPQGRKLIFSTAVFFKEKKKYEWHWATEEEAKQKHQWIVDRVQQRLTSDPDGWFADDEIQIKNEAGDENE